MVEQTHDKKKENNGPSVAFICPDSFTAWHFYKGLLKGLMDSGCQVYVISGQGEYGRLLQQSGIQYVPIQIERFLGPARDLRTIVELYRIFRRLNIDIVHSCFLKLNLYGAIAGRCAGVKHIYGTIEGLGHSYTEVIGIKRRIWVKIMDVLNKIACTLSDRIWFVNRDDLLEFVSKGISRWSKSIYIKSHGINTTDFSMQSLDCAKMNALRAEFNLGEGEVLVSMVTARAIWSKGVREFVEASKIVFAKLPYVKFLLIGQIEKRSPQSVDLNYLKGNEGVNFRWCSSFRRDVKEIIGLSDVVVLPSYYREGIPTVLLEAMALEKPIVTTDNVGCKETVEDGKNGYMVRVRDSQALSQAICTLVGDANLRREFGRYGRKKVETEFNESVVVQAVLEKLYGTSLYNDSAIVPAVISGA